MITYDASFYKEVQDYFEFEEKNEKFYKDLEDLLSHALKKGSLKSTQLNMLYYIFKYYSSNW